MELIEKDYSSESLSVYVCAGVCVCVCVCVCVSTGVFAQRLENN